MSSLTKRQRDFADMWNGRGTGVAAARAAGYRGADPTLQVTASKLLKRPNVRARIEERLGPGACERAPAEEARTPIPTDQPLVKGRGRGTQTERIELAMSIARAKKTEARDRLAGIRLAAELEGELRPARGRIGPPAPIAAPMPPPAAGSKRPALTLVMSEEDAHG